MALLTARHATGRDRGSSCSRAPTTAVRSTSGHGGEPLQLPFDWVVLPYNDIAAAEAELADRGDEIAAVLVEPMLGAGGCIPAIRRSSPPCARLTAPSTGPSSIFDEVMTSRLAVGGAQELLGDHAGPDHARQVPRRRPVLRCLRRAPRADGGVRPRRGGGLTHGGTFNNNAFTMAVGAAVARRADRRRRRWPRSTSAATACATACNARFDVVAVAVHRHRLGLDPQRPSRARPGHVAGRPGRRRSPLARAALPRPPRGRLLPRPARLPGADDGRLRRRHRSPARGRRGVLRPPGALAA